MKVENVVINESSYGVCLRWEHNGFRYHVWQHTPETIFKARLTKNEHHKVSKLDTKAKANAAMIAEAQRVAKERGLYEKATEAKRQEEADEKAKHEAAVMLHRKRMAAEDLYDALKEAVLYIGPTQRPAPEELYAKINAAFAKADGKE